MSAGSSASPFVSFHDAVRRGSLTWEFEEPAKRASERLQPGPVLSRTRHFFGCRGTVPNQPRSGICIIPFICSFFSMQAWQPTCLLWKSTYPGRSSAARHSVLGRTAESGGCRRRRRGLLSTKTACEMYTLSLDELLSLW